MPISTSRLTALAFVCGLVAACDGPTDSGAGTYVALTADAPIVLRGERIDFHARVWRKQAKDSVELPNVEFSWTLTNGRMAAIQSVGHGVVRVTGINPGYDTVRVVAAGLQSSQPATLAFRIADALTIDSLQPTHARYGTQIRAYGVGLNNVFAMLVGGGVMLADTLLDQGDTNGLYQRSYWVLYGAGTGKALALSSGGGIYTKDTIFVADKDIYDPNKDTPATLDLTATPFPSEPHLHFLNPGLAFETQPSGADGRDWYRWQATDSTQPYTIVFSAQQGLAGADSITLVSQRSANGHGTWSVGQTFGSAMADCKGYAFRPTITPTDGLVFPMTHLHGNTMDLSADFSATGGYTMAAVDGYVITDSAAMPDRFESSSDCLFADENFSKAPTHIELTTSAGFSDSLTIDHPEEIDWLRFRVDGAAPQVVDIQTVATVGAGVLNLYVLNTSNLATLAADTSGAATSEVAPVLPPGDYYAVIVDAYPAPTRYALCMSIVAPGGQCTPLALAPSAVKHRRTVQWFRRR